VGRKEKLAPCKQDFYVRAIRAKARAVFDDTDMPVFFSFQNESPAQIQRVGTKKVPVEEHYGEAPDPKPVFPNPKVSRSL
jgi:hypothetical protein